MTDIDAIRKRVSSLLDWPMPGTAFEDGRPRVKMLSADALALLSAYDAKCEELARIVEQPVGKYVDRMVEKRCEELEAERDAAVRDAQRYRWLRNRGYIAGINGRPFCVYDGKAYRYGYELDDAIDAQLAALAPPTEQQKVML